MNVLNGLTSAKGREGLDRILITDSALKRRSSTQGTRLRHASRRALIRTKSCGVAKAAPFKAASSQITSSQITFSDVSPGNSRSLHLRSLRSHFGRDDIVMALWQAAMTIPANPTNPLSAPLAGFHFPHTLS